MPKMLRMSKQVRAPSLSYHHVHSGCVLGSCGMTGVSPMMLMTSPPPGRPSGFRAAPVGAATAAGWVRPGAGVVVALSAGGGVCCGAASPRVAPRERAAMATAGRVGCFMLDYY